MTVPTRPVRRMNRGRRFDLRVTTLFFVLLAVILCALVYLARTAAHIVESRPLWAVSLLLVAVATAWLGRARWRRFSAARCARRAAEVLEEAAERASDSLDDLTAGERVPPAARTAAPGEEYAAAPVIPAPAPPADERLIPDVTRVAPDARLPAEEEPTVVVGFPDDYEALDPDGFEEAIAELCVRDACSAVEVVGGACDLGADVVAVAPDGRRIIIQCKRYSDTNKVGSQDLQRFGGTCFTVHEADVAALVTTSDFTAPALEYAAQCGIVCVNGAELDAWRDGSGPSPWERVVPGADACD